MKKFERGLKITLKTSREDYDIKYRVTYNGKTCRRLGGGSYRDVFKIPGENYIVKLPNCDDELDEDQTSTEYETYKALVKNRKLQGHLARTYKPFQTKVCNKQGESLEINVGIQEYVKGVHPYNRSVPREKSYDDFHQYVDDIHCDNVLYSHKRKKFVIVDFGRGEV